MADTLLIKARFENYQAFERALHSLKNAQMRRYEAYGPTNLQEIEDLMPKRGSPVRIWSTGGAILGLATFWLMCVMTALIYDLIVGGKPSVSNIPYIVPAYEGTILAGAVLAFIAAIIYAMLGFHGLPRAYNERYSADSYGVHVYCSPNDRGRIMQALTDAGAVDIIEEDTSLQVRREAT